MVDMTLQRFLMNLYVEGERCELFLHLHPARFRAMLKYCEQRKKEGFLLDQRLISVFAGKSDDEPIGGPYR